MKTIKNILITGITGFFGGEYVRTLLKDPANKVYGIVRAKRNTPFDQRKELSDLIGENLTIVPGDVTKPGVLAEGAELPRIDEIIHLAAYTGFKECDRELLEQINIGGVKHMVELAKTLGPDRFIHVSTAYVAGTAQRALEDELIEAPTFRNAYEETKYSGERIVRASGLPFIIARPSIIQGDSRTGKAESDKMAYGILKTLHRLKRLVQREYRDHEEYKCTGGIPPDLSFLVQGRPQTKKNMITSDDVIDIIEKVRLHGEIGKTYHVCNPTNTTLGDIFDYMQQSLEMSLIRLDPDEEPDNNDKRQRLMTLGVQDYRLYMLHDDPEFDMTNTLILVDPQDIHPYDEAMHLFLNNQYIKDHLEGQEAAVVKGQKVNSRLPAIRKYGRSILSYSALLDEFFEFATPGIDGFIPYVVADNTAILVGKPLTAAEEPAVKSFIRMCAENDYSPCAIEIPERTARIFHDEGFEVNKLGIETHLLLDRIDLSLPGKEYEAWRRWRNHAQTNGIRVAEKKLAEVNPSSIRNISDEWLKTKKNKDELGVLLRRLDLTSEPYVRRFFAYHGDELLGYVFFDPVFSAGRIEGYYANIERYVTTNGQANLYSIRPYILLEATRQFIEENEQGAQLRFVSLGLCPLHGLGGNPFRENVVIKEYFEELYEKSDLYAFKGVSQHKNKYPGSAKVDEPVYIAFKKGSSTDDIFNVFDRIGII